MNSQNDDSAAADRFRLVAQRFCSLVDSAVTLDKTGFLLQVYRMLPELIGEAMRLPAGEFGNDDTAEDEVEDLETLVSHVQAKARIGQEEWNQLYNALKEKLGDWNLYWQVFDPTKDNEAIRGSLADDIAGIHCDLKRGIDPTESEQALPHDIIFEWRLGFYSHWGRHAMNALYTIHSLLSDTLGEL
jgi:hypothetical protein